jgi:hypothetical protein
MLIRAVSSVRALSTYVLRGLKVETVEELITQSTEHKVLLEVDGPEIVSRKKKVWLKLWSSPTVPPRFLGMKHGKKGVACVHENRDVDPTRPQTLLNIIWYQFCGIASFGNIMYELGL